MARFETKEQIGGLFLAAGAVAVLLILLLNAEVGREEEVDVEEAGVKSGGLVWSGDVWNKIRTYWSSMSQPASDGTTGSNNDSSLKRSARRKREARVDDIEVDENRPGGGGNSPVPGERLLEEAAGGGRWRRLLEEAAGNHSIRHLREKVKHLGEKDELVGAVLDTYCRSETYYFTNFINCTGNTSSSKNDSASGRKEYSHNTPLLGHGLEGLNYTVSPRLFCSCDFSAHTTLVVVVTTLTNFTLFALLLCLCKLCKDDSQHSVKEDRVWLCEDDPSHLDDNQQPTGQIILVT